MKQFYDNLYRILRFLSRYVCLSLLIPVSTFTALAQQWELINPVYETQDAFVAGFSVDDFGASGDGFTDVTTIIQERIDALASIGGGTVFLPQGRYVVRGSLTLRKGVILRGEWKKPVKGQAPEGTILMVYKGRGSTSENLSFITLQPSSSVQDMIFWYPEQIPGNITPYPPTIVLGEPDYFGNDYCNVKNITLVNSFTGIVYSSVNGGSCPVLSHIYGTPLSLGIEIDNIADVGRVDKIHFSPQYWLHSGLPNAPSPGSAFEDWIFNNGTGIAMRRNDWSYACFVNIEGYHKGLHLAPSGGTSGAAPNGHNYNMVFKNCHTAMYFETISDVGIMYSRVNIIDCENGITIASGTRWPIQFHSSTISARQNAITTDAESKPTLMMLHCKVYSGRIAISGGTWTASDCDFTDDSNPIIVGANARAILTGNRYADEGLVQNNSLYGMIVDNTPVNAPVLPEFNDTLPGIQKPGNHVMINAAESPYNAENDGVTDNTDAIQDALDEAGANGGGVVFLPPGKYKVLGTLTIPSGVELKGAVDISTAPMGPGTVLEVYSGKNNESGTPFIRLSSGSGLRAVVIDYPEQMGDLAPNFLPYPYSIQVAGQDVYIVNVGLRAAYNGIDLFTYQCNNHFIDYLSGQVLRTGIRVGNNSAGGKIWNVQFNPIGFAFGFESKWGNWSNAPSPDNVERIYGYVYDNLNFMILDECTNQSLYNNFHFGSQVGLILNGASGMSMGTAIDGSRRAVVIESVGDSRFDFINSQVVTNYDSPGTCYIESNSEEDNEVTFFNADFWGYPQVGIRAQSGKLNLQQANFRFPGTTEFANINSGYVKMQQSAITEAPVLLNAGTESKFSALSSILDPTGIVESNCAVWINNLPNEYVFDESKIFSRTGWTATASLNNEWAGNGIDGNDMSRWDGGVNQSSGQWYAVDMQTSKTFNQIIMDYVLSALDFPAGYAVFVSDDGINWGDAITAGQGIPEITYIEFPAQTARHIKIVQTGSTPEKFWSIHELDVMMKIVDPVTEVIVSPTFVRLGMGETNMLEASVFPGSLANTSVLWSTSDPAVATVSEGGEVVATGAGTALITATSAGGEHRSSCVVSVAIPVSSVDLQPGTLSLEMDSEYQLTPVIDPASATFKEVSWKSANPAVAVVNNSGMIRAVGVGTTQIILTSLDNGSSDFCTVTVSPMVGLYEPDSEKSDFKISPNPANTIAYLEVNANRHSEILIDMYDMNGRHIRSFKKAVTKDHHRFALNIEDICPGLYIVHIVLDNELFAKKLVVR